MKVFLEGRNKVNAENVLSKKKIFLRKIFYVDIKYRNDLKNWIEIN